MADTSPGPYVPDPNAQVDPNAPVDPNATDPAHEVPQPTTSGDAQGGKGAKGSGTTAGTTKGKTEDFDATDDDGKPKASTKR